MKYKLILFITIMSITLFAQDEYKKKVLEASEVEYLMSLYQQNGDHSSVGGGIGTEELTNVTPTIVISVPIGEDNVLKIDAGVSAYTSASSSNINPFNASGASQGGGGEGDDDDDHYRSTSTTTVAPTGTPWQSSTGASKSDALVSLNIGLEHSSDSRNLIYGGHVSASNEFDYTSFGFGGNINGLFNEQNTELGFKLQVYLDQWRPIYPTELKEYSIYGANFLSSGFFSGVDVLNASGNISTNYNPVNFEKWSNSNRNSYSASLFLSQILTRRMQVALFSDLVLQQGLLSTPYHRMYFQDLPNYYIGTAADIPNYQSKSNTTTYQLADDIERLPDTRFKVPVGARLNYYINDYLVLRTYYRYYFDDWDINSHTFQLELPIKFKQKFVIAPDYRYYNQTAAKYFAGYEQHLSTEEFYTSDPDLAKFHSNQYGVRFTYNDIFSDFKVGMLGLKNFNIRYDHYARSDGLKANIVTFSVKFQFQ